MKTEKMRTGNMLQHRLIIPAISARDSYSQEHGLGVVFCSAIFPARGFIDRNVLQSEILSNLKNFQEANDCHIFQKVHFK